MQKFRRLLLAGLLTLLPGVALALQAGGDVITYNNAVSNTVTALSPVPTTLTTVQCTNSQSVAAITILEFFDTTGTVTLGTTTPTFALAIPGPVAPGASTYVPINAGFANGIKYAAVTVYNGAVAPGAALSCAFGRH